MDENLENESSFDEDEEIELSHLDKLVGVFAEPSYIFNRMSGRQIKHIDWLFPILLTVIVAVLANYVMMSNPQIRYAVMEKQFERIENTFNEMVESGTLTKEEADTKMDEIRDNIEDNMANGKILQIIGIFIFTFGTLIVVSLVFWSVSKFILKGEGDYNTALVAYGLPYYITAVQIIVMVILALTMNKFIQGTSLGAILDADTSTLSGFLLAKLDPFSIWFYAVVSIAYAKMFKGKDLKSYMLMIFGLWLSVGLVFHFLSKAVPFLNMLGG